MTLNGNRRTRTMLLAACAALAIVPATAYAQGTPQRVSYNIAAQDLGTALTELARQSNREIVFSAELTRGKMAPRLSGRMTFEQALDRLLKGSGLGHRVNANGSVVIEAGAASVGNGPESDETASDDGRGKSEILVVGRRSQNADIKRTEDDPQPYVVLGREEIERSGAVDLNDFFRKRLPMNSQGTSAAQGQPSALNFGAASEINLRGLGSNQTLILVDGRRLPSAQLSGSPAQPSINGIPIASIERIEILPTTASGIYGGGATGGVINIILRHDYRGGELRASLSRGQNKGPLAGRLDVSKGFSFGRTQLTVSGSYQRSQDLQFKDRDFIQRARTQIATNNPAGLVTSGVVPPLGYTTNIRSLDGSPLFGPGTPNFASVPVGYAGGGGLNPFSATAGRFNLDLANTADSTGGRRDLLPNETDISLFSTIRHDLNSSITLFLDANYQYQRTKFSVNSAGGAFLLPAGAANNPFGKDVVVNPSFSFFDTALVVRTDSARLAGGVIYKLGGGWSSEADLIWGSYRIAPGQIRGPRSLDLSAAIGNGTVDVLRDYNIFPIDLSKYLAPSTSTSPNRSTSLDVTWRAAGPLFRLPGGAAKLTTLLEHRLNKLEASTIENFNQSSGAISTTFFPDRSQAADSAYAEITAPIVGDKNRFVLARQLDLQLAVRIDRYTTNGVTGGIVVGSGSPVVRVKNTLQSIDPTIALLWSPIKGIALRASYGTGFLPPTVNQLVSTNGTFAVTVTDPKRGGATTTIPVGGVLGGGNPNLLPEESRSWSWGVVLTPTFAQGLRLSVDAAYIHKRNNIVSTPYTSQGLVNNEDLFPDRILRGPPASGQQYGPIIGLNQTLFNLARAYVEAYDFSADYAFDVAEVGSFDLRGRLTWQPHYRTQATPAASIVENIGITIFNPQRIKANAGITWRSGRFLVDWSARYFDSYRASTSASVSTNQGNGGRVPSQFYQDVFVSYKFSTGPSKSKFSDGLELQLSVNNILNKRPPVDLGNDRIFYSTLADPRLRYVTIALKKSF